MRPLNPVLAKSILLLCLTIATQVQAQNVRCTNAAGVVVGYAESAAYCPKDGAASPAMGAPASQPTPAQTTQAKKLAQSTQKQADDLEAARLKSERAQAKANAASAQKQSAQDKRCKKQALAIANAQANVEEARMKALKKGATKAKKPPKTAEPTKSKTTATAQRPDDEPSGKAYQKAKRQLALLEAKRDIDCK